MAPVRFLFIYFWTRWVRWSRSEAIFARLADSCGTIEFAFDGVLEGTVSGWWWWWWCVCSAKISLISSAMLVARPVLTVRSEFSFD